MIRQLTVCALACGLLACGNVGSRYVKAESVTTKGGLVQVQAADNAQLSGTSLAIPAGALSATTVITVDLVNSALLEPDVAAGPTVEWGPSGTIFANPAEMQLPYLADDQDEIFVQVQEANGQRFEIDSSHVAVDATNKLVRFRVNGFTRFQVGARRQCRTNANCSAGKACRAGRCAAVCASSADCGTNQACVNGACQSPGNTCVTNAQCLTNQVCLSNKCTVFNAIDAGSASDGGVDEDGGTGAKTCDSNASCGGNEVCIAGLCVVQACSFNSDCTVGNACVGGVCRPIDYDGGGLDLDAGDLDAGIGDGGLGAHCVNNEQCGGAAYCGSDFQCHDLSCSTDSDCGAGQACAPNDLGEYRCQIIDLDAGVDGGFEDGGIDGGPFEPDAGHLDGGEADAGNLDGGLDAGDLDGGASDGGGLDAGEADAGLDGGESLSCRADFDCLTGQHCIGHVCQ